MKNLLRAQMKFKRNELSKNDVEVMSEKIFFNLKNILDCNSRFFVYVSFSNEAKTDKCNNQIWES